MATRGANKPTVPISYVLLMLDLVAEHGISRAQLLSGLAVSDALLEDPGGRISLLEEYATLCHRALALTGEPALAYEFGLRATLTTHGILGYGLMSQRTFRDVFDFADRYGSILRMPAWNLRFFTQGDHAIMEGREAVSHGSLRRFSCEQLLISVSSIIRQLLPPDPALELLFDYPEPPYHARYRHRLPPVHFETGVTQLRMPVAYLDRQLLTADVVSAKLAERECARELALLGHTEDVVTQVRAALLQEATGGYPGLEIVATRLHLTSRTLVRRLAEQGYTFRQLLDAARHRDSLELLADRRMSLADIAARLGYSSAANFSRAFQNWTGSTPGRYRDQARLPADVDRVKARHADGNA